MLIPMLKAVQPIKTCRAVTWPMLASHHARCCICQAQAMLIHSSNSIDDMPL